MYALPYTGFAIIAYLAVGGVAVTVGAITRWLGRDKR